METSNNLPSNSIEKQEQQSQNFSTLTSNNNVTTKPKSSKTRILWLAIIIFICVIGFIGWIFVKNINTTSNIPQSPQIRQNINERGILRVGENIDEDGLAADTKEFQPFINYLVAHLRQYGYTKGEFVGTHSVSEMAEMVREGKIDIVVDSAFPVYVVGQLANAQVIADRWKGGVGTYHSAIFVKQTSSIQTINDLKGKILAFDSNTSTVGYFLPKAELIKQGYTLTQKINPTDACSSKEICYIFVHGNVYASVEKGIIPAGAENEYEINDYFGNKIINYRIINRSPDISRFLVATSSSMDPKLTDTIKNILFTMDQNPQGRQTLHSFADTAKFTPIENNDAAYGEIKSLSNVVEDEIIKQ